MKRSPQELKEYREKMLHEERVAKIKEMMRRWGITGKEVDDYVPVTMEEKFQKVRAKVKAAKKQVENQRKAAEARSLQAAKKRSDEAKARHSKEDK